MLSHTCEDLAFWVDKLMVRCEWAGFGLFQLITEKKKKKKSVPHLLPLGNYDTLYGFSLGQICEWVKLEMPWF